MLSVADDYVINNSIPLPDLQPMALEVEDLRR